MRSSDGSQWTKTVVGTNDFLGIAHSESNLVIVGNRGTVLNSNDGVNWMPQNSGIANNLKGVTYGNGIYVAVGGGANRFVSTNQGVSWSLASQGTQDKTDFSIAFGNGRFVVVSELSASSLNIPLVGVSTNAQTWKEQAPDSGALLRVSFVRGQFLVGGRIQSPGATTLLLTSDDGDNWIRRVLTTTAEPYTFAGGNELIVAGASSGFILRSGPYLTCGIERDPLRLQLSGPVPGVYRIEQSEDIRNWSHYTNVQLTTSPQNVSLPAGPPIKSFFRAASQ